MECDDDQDEYFFESEVESEEESIEEIPIKEENEDCVISLDNDVSDQVYELQKQEIIKEEINKNIIRIERLKKPILTKDHVNPTNPLEALMLIMTPEILGYMAEQTNNHAREKMNMKFRTDGDEVLDYLMLFIYLSVIDLPEVEMLWDKSEYYSTVIPKVMSKERYGQFRKYFLIFENEKVERDKVYGSLNKINKILDHFNTKWKENYNYSQYLTVDECMAAFKGRIPYRQMIKSKRKGVGMKFFAKANSLNGYMYTVTPYNGRFYEYDKNVGCGPTALIDLMEDHKNSNTHFCFDNWYTSIGIIEYCHLNNIFFTCTWLQNRKGFPELLRKRKLKRNEMECYNIKNTDIRYLIFFDNKQVHLATNKYKSDIVEYVNHSNVVKTKPELIAYYNFFKSGIDMVDSICNVYSSKRVCHKWWKSVFFYLFDISIHNSSIIYYDRHKSFRVSKMLNFRRQLYELQFQKYLLPNEPKLEEKIYSIFDNKNKVVEIHYQIKGTKSKECQECVKERLTNPNLKYIAKSKYLCVECGVNLCQNCFPLYHEDIAKNYYFNK